MAELSNAQREVLAKAIEIGGLFRGANDGWNWYRKHPTGHVSRVAGNATIICLKRMGFLEHAGADVVTPTKAGRAALQEAGR